MSQSALAQKIYTPATVVNIFHHRIGSNELFLSNCLKRWVYPAIPEISSTLVYITNIINSHKTVLPLSSNKNNFSCAGHQRSLKKLVQVKRSFVRPSAPLPPAPSPSPGCCCESPCLVQLPFLHQVLRVNGTPSSSLPITATWIHTSDVTELAFAVQRSS